MKIEDLSVHMQLCILKHFFREPNNLDSGMTMFPTHHPAVLISPPMLINGKPTDDAKPQVYSFAEPDPRVRETYDPPRAPPATPPAVKEWLEIRRGHIKGRAVSGIRVTNEGRRRLYHLLDIVETAGALA